MNTRSCDGKYTSHYGANAKFDSATMGLKVLQFYLHHHLLQCSAAKTVFHARIAVDELAQS